MLSKSALDFPDSEVSIVELRDQQLIIRFSAAHIHQTKNQDEGPGFIKLLELTIDQPTIIQNDDGCIGRLSQGMLRVSGATIKHVPIAYEAWAEIELELIFANGSICKVKGKGISLKTTGEMHATEWLRC